MKVSEDSPREAELAALLNGALVGCPVFLTEVLRILSAHEPTALSGTRIRVEYSPGETNKRFDLYLNREDPALSIAFELKRDESGLSEAQIREYLALLGLIQDDRSLRRRKNAPKYSMLVVITGATEEPSIIQEVTSAGKGFLKANVKWLSWYELMDIVEDLPGNERSNPLVKQFTDCLSEQGYVSHQDSLPRLRQQEKVLAKILEHSKELETENDMLVLDAALGRLEFQMAKLGYGVTIHVAVKSRRKTISRQRATKIGKHVSVFGHKLRSIGRTFLPIQEIKEFEHSTKSTKGQKSGVGIAYSIAERGWIAYINPKRGFPIPNGFVAAKGTSNRVPLSFSDSGIHGWLLKGRDKQPEKVARFLRSTWMEYLEEHSQ